MSAIEIITARSSQLLRMRAARDHTTANLATIRQRLAQTAERRTRAATDLPPSHRRHSSDWTKRHEARFQRILSELTSEARHELGALEAKLKRQTAAIACHHLRHARHKA
ncbi:hypothetical protein PK98_15760 [Croceibacterium mercuriale]|uniref:Uncharacterized protein n=1 Tax=Croceibacterium mercuriale TaxID=1572751 RepID=A0A0B2BRC1_9SPHN|nr:hypothetical protein [Croceibacterium mercuriale]KHL24095.1 hypothetical protein PK98_15760 [Croceibacterium mercuriale]